MKDVLFVLVGSEPVILLVVQCCVIVFFFCFRLPVSSQGTTSLFFLSCLMLGVLCLALFCVSYSLIFVTVFGLFV